MLVGLLLLYVGLNNNTLGLDQIQTYKSGSDIRYLLYSCFSLLIVFFMKDRLKINFKNIFAFIGRNALLFYFAQGISSSILYLILPKITINIWFVKLIVMFIINVLLTTLLSLTIKFLCDMTSKIKLKNLEFIERKFEKPITKPMLTENIEIKSYDYETNKIKN